MLSEEDAEIERTGFEKDTFVGLRADKSSAKQEIYVAIHRSSKIAVVF